MAKATHTPLIAQYLEIRQQYPDAMLFFQVGDFYELFFEDAITAANYLAITLTKRGKANGQDIPLCGVPVHALSHYLMKLVRGGYTVALCDQLSKPQPGTVVKRAVTKVYTPGTLTDEQLLDEKSASYLCTLFTLTSGTQRGLVFTELLTGHSVATVIDGRADRVLETELARFSPDEVVVVPGGTDKEQALLRKWGYVLSPLREHADQSPLNADDLLTEAVATKWVTEQFAEVTQQHIAAEPALRGATELLYRYLARNNPSSLSQITALTVYEAESYVQLDAATLRNLAVVRNQENSSSHTLFSVMDAAQTAMGSRLLKKWLVRPLRDVTHIQRRQAAVGCFTSHVTLLSQLKDCLRSIGDLERIVGRIALGRAIRADYCSLRTALENLAPLKQLLGDHTTVPLIEQLLAGFPQSNELIHLLAQSLNTDINSDHIIRAGFSAELDELRELATNGQNRIQALAVREATDHEISSLKILYTSVAGYFIEVTKTHLDKVPEHYRQVQTLANRARFITTELKDLEQTLATAQERVTSLEKQLYERVQAQVHTWVPQLRRAANALATIDALYAFAHVAYTHSYVAPSFNSDGMIAIEKGRHPVVEQSLTEPFVANDAGVGEAAWLWIITGPNMGGKSTYLRQVALICLLAQCGSFVPATSANLSLVDRIFTRIGAGDNVAQGKSTFLVEMEETATICGQATKDSLVILDEVGRGTSTEDGRALAHAIIEYLAHTVQARTLFATHYHELTHLAQTEHGIANYHVECHKRGDTLHFLHTLAPGVAHASFGIEVAKLAHLPKSVIARARALLDDHGASYAAPPPQNETITPAREGPSEAVQHPVLHELASLDLDELSPRAAFDLLAALQSRL